MGPSAPFGIQEETQGTKGADRPGEPERETIRKIKKEDIFMENNAVIRAMVERRSIRGFQPQLPPREMIDAVIKAGLYAPSGMGRQSPIVVAVTDKALRDRLSEMNRAAGGMEEGTDPFYGGPVVLAVLARREATNRVYDGSLTMGNMLLAAHALGLGGIWIHRAREVFDTEEGKAILRDLGVEGDYEGIGNCVIGYAAGEAPAAAPRLPGRVYWAQ